MGIIEFKAVHQSFDITDDFGTHYQTAGMADQALSQIGDVVHQIGTVQCIGHDGNAPLHAGLLIQAVGVADSGGPPHGQSVIVV